MSNQKVFRGASFWVNSAACWQARCGFFGRSVFAASLPDPRAADGSGWLLKRRPPGKPERTDLVFCAV